MSTRILLVVLLVAVVLAIPAAFLLGRRGSAPLPVAPTQPAVPDQETGPDVADAAGSQVDRESATPGEVPAPAPEKSGGLFGDLVAAVSDRVVDESRRIVDHTVDEVGKEVSARVDDASAKLEKELGERLDKGRKELDRASRKLGEELDQRSDSLTRSTVAESERLAEQSEAIAKAGRASADTINRSASDLRTLITTSVEEVNQEADAAKAKLIKLLKDGGTRTQKLVGKAGVALPGTTARISSELATGLKRWLDEVDATQADFQKRTVEAHQRFTKAVNQAQAEAEHQRQKALALVQGANDALRDQVVAAERELTEAVKRAENDADQALAKILGKANEPQAAGRANEAAARRGGK